jgi:large subunit ribosomal protein L21
MAENTYAVVKTGGNQTKVSVDDIVVVNRMKDDKGAVHKVGAKVELPAVLYVSGAKPVLDPAKLAKVKVTAEVVAIERGKKIVAMKYKNKTGYKKRWGHRQELSRLKVTSIKTAA